MGLASVPMLTAALLVPLLADVVVLKNGQEIQGEVLSEEKDRVVVRFPGGTLELQRRQVAEIRRQTRLEYLIDEGTKRLRRGEDAAAVEAYADAMKEDASSDRARTGWLEARVSHARALSNLGRYQEAGANFRDLLADVENRAEIEREIEIIDQVLREAAEEERRGLEEIRGADPEKGIFRLQMVFDRFPERRAIIAEPLGQALIRQGNKLLDARDWSGAEAKYLRAITTEPELVPQMRRQHAHLKAQQIEPALRAGDFATVAARTAEGLEIDPLSRPLRYYRGLALEAQGKRREAAEEYLALLDRKRPANLESAVADLRLEAECLITTEGNASPQAPPRAREVLPGKSRELRTAHFSIWHRNQEIAREVAFVAERAYTQTFKLLGCSAHLREPIQIHVFPTREEYTTASGLEAWSGGAHRVARQMGVLSEHRIYTFQDQPGLSSGILPHEIRHALLAHRLNYPSRLPLWANEGFAVLGEARYIHGRYRRFIQQESRRMTLLPVKDIIASDRYPADALDLFYAQSFSLVELLIQLEGLEAFLRFVKDLSDPGASVDTALRAHYSIAGVQALENRWRGWFESSVK